MRAPSGYTALGVIGYTDKGTYSPSTTYNRYNVVLYNGSSYVALQDGLLGVTPSNNGTQWRLFAQGVPTEVITPSNFQDTLKQYLANNGTTNQEGFALDARFGKTLQDQVTELNSNLALIQPAHASAAINTFEELFAIDQQKNGIAKTVMLDWNSSISPDSSDTIIFVWGWCALAISTVGGIYCTLPSDNKWTLLLKRVSGSDGGGVWTGIDIGTLTGNPYRIYATQTAIGFQEVNTQGSVIRQIGTVNFSN